MSETIKDVKQARAVLTAAKENDVWESPIPQDEEQLLEDARFVYSQSCMAWNNGMRGKAVTAVKFAGEVVGSSEGEDFKNPELDEDFYVPSDYKATDVVQRIVELEDEGNLDEICRIGEMDKRKGVKRAADSAMSRLDRVEAQDDVALEEIDGKDDEVKAVLMPGDTTLNKHQVSKLDEMFEAEEFAKAQARKLNLPVPGKVDDIPSATLGRNVATLTVQELAERLTDASLCLAAATWHTAIAEIDEEHAKRVGNHYFNKEYAKAAPNAKNKEAAVAKAEEEAKVREWRDREAEAENRYITFRSLKEIYKGTYDTVSRVFAMKQEERERT